jgi:diguanylate cyclase (GGDEF)-like protein/putative nucleotidyltransferase with HDIG domain
MNIYAFIPLVASIAYIPLLISTLGARPWRKQHRLFFLVLIAAILWSLVDYIFRSNYFPHLGVIFIRTIIFLFSWMAVQLHYFTSSFFPADKNRWLPVAYGFLLLTGVLLVIGYIPQNLELVAGIYYPRYGYGIAFVAVPLIVLLARNVYVLAPRLKNQDNPVIYNQTVALLICLGVLAVFMIASIFPFGSQFAFGHIGNMIDAIILSYAVVGHRLLDIRLVLRRGLVWVSMGIIALFIFLGLLIGFQTLLNIEVNFGLMFGACVSATIAAILIYKLRDIVSRFMGKAFQGESYYYREKLLDFSGKIHNVFSLKEQGGELLTLITHAVGCSKAGLLFPNPSEDYELQLIEPADDRNPLSEFNLKGDNPIIQFLRRERRPLMRESLSMLPEFLGLWQQEKQVIETIGIEIFMPLISRDRLIGILVLDNKKSGRYTLEDFSLLENVTSRVGVSMEKEYLREQLKEREEELSIINRSSAIITSSLDIQRIYDNFIQELKRVVDVDWAAIAVIEEAEIYFMAISTEIGSPWKVGERIPLKGTAAEWVARHRKLINDPDLSIETRFTTGKYHLQHAIKSIVYLPLIISDQVIGTLTVASRKPNAYNSRHLKLLEQLAAQVSMPIENARLYAKTERMARVDSLTSLLNRRSLDEILPREIGRHSRYGGVFSLIILDLDSFKSLNDNYGHLAGDEILRQIGAVIKNSIREADQAFRYGGDELAILLPQTSTGAAQRVAERIRLQTFAKLEIGSIPITISLGLACWPADGLGTDNILAAADAALYQAKRSGGNRSVCFSPDLKPLMTIRSNALESQDSSALSTIFALAATVDSRSQPTRNHSKLVHDYTIAFAEELGLDPLEINRLGTCALLHDVGKIGISDEILNKNDTLTEEEWKMIKSHPVLGAAIASHSSQLSQCIQGILHHHEKYNGEGYPDGLKGEEIPLESRILAIADSFAAMTSIRPYSVALTHEAAMEELKSGAGRQFDPKLIKVFLNRTPVKISNLDNISKNEVTN